MQRFGSRATLWLRRSLGARLVALFLGLLAAVQAASFGAISIGLNQHARDALPGQLAVGERVLQRLLEQRAAKLVEGATLLAADFGFKAAVLSQDAETIGSALANQAERIHAREAALLAPDFTLRAASGGADMQALAPAAARLAAQAGAKGQAVGIAMLDGVAHQVVLVPMKAPQFVGWVMMGFPIDAALVTDLQQLSALNLTLLTRAQDGVPWTVALSGLTPARSAALSSQSWSAQGPAVTGLRSVTLDGEEFGVHGTWLTPTSAAISGDAGAPDGAAVLALVSVSIDDATRTPRELQLGLLAITLAAFGVFALGSLYTARRVTTPLRALATAAERLGGGDYDTPLHGHRREDEIGQLAQTFETMRVNVADHEAQIRRLAFWDTLTGLPNRVQFRDTVRDAIEQAEAAGTTLAVIMLDLDRFKNVNDKLGYRIGDLLLVGVAQRLSQQIVRGDDLVARLSGDKFAVLLRHGDTALAAQVAQRITLAFAEALVLEDNKVDMSAGIGMACWPQHAADADTLLNRAEVAMYAAKRHKDDAVLYDASIDAASAQTLSLLSELRHAVEHGELRLYLQPKLELGNGTVVGAEALVRWAHPQRGLVPPMQFIPFAEQTGFIRVLTMWVFEEAARQWLALHGEGLRLVLSVNLSTRDLLDTDLPAKFDALLVKHGVPAEAFCLEITESAIMDDPQRALATLNRLSGLGFKLSIDDFGTGYSSLDYLQRLPVDELKIDQCFVKNMEGRPDDAKIVRWTIELAHDLGLRVVAEGVENARVWELLRELDCDQAQGYHMGKPMPADEFKRWTTGWSARQPAAAPRSAALLH